MATIVPRIHVIGICFVFAGLVSYYFSYYSYMQISGNDQPFATFVASILQVVNPPDEPAELAFTESRFYINDARAAVFWFALSVLTSLVGAGLALFHRLRFGPSKLFVPLCFTSLLVAACLAKVTFDMGVLNAT